MRGEYSREQQAKPFTPCVRRRPISKLSGVVEAVAEGFDLRRFTPDGQVVPVSLQDGAVLSNEGRYLLS